MKSGQNIVFDAQKNFTYIKQLGSGGTGDTHLFKDETTDMLFAIKKYVPKEEKYIDEQYIRFVDEIKILFNISHPNIVRIYNYYLFPNQKTGYLQMEYIDGVSIDKFCPDEDGWGKSWNDIFIETISAFKYLEDHNILHRDIRPNNIMVDSNENVKIIDFGFGKQLSPEYSENNKENSVLLNWPVTEMPNEIQLAQEYNNATEIYFVGKLFQHLLENDTDFLYNYIIDKMIKLNPEERFKSFSEVSKTISSGVIAELDFTPTDKRIYQEFANRLTNIINYYMDNYKPVENIQQIKLKLADVIRNSSLEEYIQQNSHLISCFVNCGYNYRDSQDIPVKVVVDFYELITRLTTQQQNLLYANLYNRLSKIRIEVQEDDFDEDDLPF